MPPAREAAPEAAEIDISNEWEEMIEVEPEEAPAPALEVQSYQEIMAEPAMAAEVPLEPVVSIEPEQPDVSTQIADKIQEIRFYISQANVGPGEVSDPGFDGACAGCSGSD